MVVGNVFHAFRHQLEQGHSVNLDCVSHACGKGFYGVAVIYLQEFVGAVHGAWGELVYDFQTGYDGYVVKGVGFFQIPFGAVVGEGPVGGDIGKGGDGVSAGFAQAADNCARADIVTADGELVGPALKGVFHVAVYHHVFGKAVKGGPCSILAVQGGLGGIVQYGKALANLLSQRLCGRFRIGWDNPEHGCAHNCGGHGYQCHGNPLPYGPFLIHGDMVHLLI